MTSFVGRDTDLAELRAAFAEAFVVTLVGPGGVGKTRLAQRFAELDSRFLFCDLTEAIDVDGVCDAVAHVLGSDRERNRLDDLGARAAARGPVLVVLDNCEQAIGAVATCVARWQALAPNARWLAASREPLRIKGERVFSVEPLSENDALRLFSDRASLVSRDYRPDEAAREIVRRLDGMPLAIELAAARMAMMTSRELLERLGRGLDALGTGPRDAPARQRTLRATIEWSWALLEPSERLALAQCAIFRGGFTIDAAEHVLDLGGAPVLDVLQALVDKSLVRRTGERLGFYETIREFLLERLDPSVRERHARWFATSCEAWARGHIVEVRDDDACDLARLGVELENLLAAHEWLLANDPDRATTVVLALDPALRAIGAHDKLLGLHSATLDRASGPLRGRVFLGRSWIWRLRGDHAKAEADASSALDAAREANDALLEARARVVIGYDEQLRGAIDRALPHYEAALAIARRIAHRGLEAYVLLAIADAHLFAGRLEESVDLFRKSAEIFRALGKPSREADAIGDLALALQELGRFDDARRAYERACELVENANDRYAFASNLGYLASLDHEVGNVEAADRGYARAIALLGNAAHRSVFIAARGALLAANDRIADAERAFEEAESILHGAGSELERRVIGIHRGHLELAFARQSPARKEELLARVRALTGDPERRSDEVRFARRLLERALRIESNELVVAADGRAFRLGGREVDLHAHHKLRRVLLALVQAHARSPGKPLSVEEMLRTAWPGEQLLFDAARNRVYVAVSTLRRSGLRDVLLSDGDGYLLDPRLPVRIG